MLIVGLFATMYKCSLLENRIKDVDLCYSVLADRVEYLEHNSDYEVYRRLSARIDTVVYDCEARDKMLGGAVEALEEYVNDELKAQGTVNAAMGLGLLLGL